MSKNSWLQLITHHSSLITSLPASVDHRLKDFHVAGAAAQIAREPVANLRLVGPRCALQKIDGGDDHARSADAALRASADDECFLYGVQLLVGGDAFDGFNGRALDLQDGHETTVHQRAIKQHGAGPALAFAAALLRAC